jgi:hypothetical protein
MSEAATQPVLPRWQSHKSVSADRITGVVDGEGQVLFRWHLACGLTVDVGEWLASRVPSGVSPIGGYYVLYEKGGYESWSPGDVFDAGYTREA